MIKLFKKIFSTSFVNVSSIFGSLFINYILANVFGPAGVGIVNISNKTLNIFSVFSQTGLRSVILRDNSGNKDNSISDSFRASVVVNGLISLFLTISIICIIHFYGSLIYEESNGIFEAVTITILALFPIVISQLLSSFFAAKKNPIFATFIDQTGVVILTSLILMALWYNDKSKLTIDLILYVYLGCRVLVLLFSISAFRYKNFKLSPLLISTKYIKESSHLFVNTFMGVLNANMDIFIITYFLPIEQVGVYAIASRLGTFLGFIEKVIMTVSGPEIVKIYKSSEINELSKYIGNLRKLLCLIAIIAFFIYFHFGKEILIFFGKDFVIGYDILLILSFATLIRLSAGPNGLLLTMTKFDRLKKNISIFSFFLLLILSFPLTGIYGLYGAALAKLCTVFCENGLQIYYSKKNILNKINGT
jgi:O-antigen/teichoic acid export membrane protein